MMKFNLKKSLLQSLLVTIFSMFPLGFAGGEIKISLFLGFLLVILYYFLVLLIIYIIHLVSGHLINRHMPLWVIGVFFIIFWLFCLWFSPILFK